MIDGVELYAGNDDSLAAVLDIGGAGGVLTGSHLFGDEMRRMVQEPQNRAGDRRRACATSTATWRSPRLPAATRPA